MNERDVLRHVHARYAHNPVDKANGLPPRYIIVEHPQAGADAQDRDHSIRTLDALVLDRYITRGVREIHGIEIKCTRADLLAELRDPTKAQAWERYCTRFWLATAPAATPDPSEIPPHWGLMAVTGGHLAILRRAKLNKHPHPLPNPADLTWRAVKTDRERR